MRTATLTAMLWALQSCTSVVVGQSITPAPSTAPSIIKGVGLYKVRQALWDNTNCTGEPVEVNVYESGECRIMTGIRMVDDINEYGIMRPLPKNVTWSLFPS